MSYVEYDENGDPKPPYWNAKTRMAALRKQSEEQNPRGEFAYWQRLGDPTAFLPIFRGVQ